VRDGPKVVKKRQFDLWTPNRQHETASDVLHLCGRLHSALTHGHLFTAMTGVVEARGGRLDCTCARKAPVVKKFFPWSRYLYRDEHGSIASSRCELSFTTSLRVSPVAVHAVARFSIA
jgi:hypothetical protein